MAHVGKFYRLHFRRDVVPSRDGHRWGFGEEYFFRVRIANSVFGFPMLQFAYTPATLHTDLESWPIEWRGGPVSASGFSWTFRYRVDRWRFEEMKAIGSLHLYRNNVHSSEHELGTVQHAPGGAWAITPGRTFPLWWNPSHWAEEPFLQGPTLGSPKAWHGGPVTP